MSKSSEVCRRVEELRHRHHNKTHTTGVVSSSVSGLSNVGTAVSQASLRTHLLRAWENQKSFLAREVGWGRKSGKV